MKIKITLFAIVALVATIGFTSCDKVKDIFYAFTTNTTDVFFTVDLITNTNVTGEIGAMSTAFNIDSTIRAETNNQFNISSINSINLEECKLTVLNPDSANNFSNFEEGDVFLFTDAIPTPIHICSGTNPDLYSDTWIIPADKTINLKTYLTGTQLSYTIAAKARRVTTKMLNCKMVIKFKVN